jgi:large subunit ribosomal protein L31
MSREEAALDPQGLGLVPMVIESMEKFEAGGQKTFEVMSAMKADIHPKYHEITVIMSDGSEFKTRSTYGEEGSSLRLDIDPKVHPAWTGGNTHLVDTGGRVGRFNKRFGNFGLKK